MQEAGGIKVLLVIGGGIAAYKSCELVRLIRKNDGEVTCVLTDGGAQFVTPMTLAALSENPVHTTLWDLKNEVEMGHIQLSREADLVVVCPATANMLAKMAMGIADDLATTLLLATDKPVMAVPAMNVRMWHHAATQANVATLVEAGVMVLDPDEGPMACGEYGAGRLPEPQAIWGAIEAWANGGTQAGTHPADADGSEPLAKEAQGGLDGLIASLIPRGTRKPAALEEDAPLLAGKGSAAAAPPDASPANPYAFDGRPLEGRHVLVTAGPTHEPIDPVRYIANRSSGKQGFAIAAAAAAAGARVTLVAGPVSLPTPPGVTRIDVQTARDMADAVRQSLPADVAVMTAAVADWRAADTRGQKMKKRSSAPPALRLEENPDILATLGTSEQRPSLLIGFAAETEDVVENALAKRERKRADWIVANDVSGPVGASVMGGADNRIHLVTDNGVEDWPEMAKEEVAMKLVGRIAEALEPRDDG
ncbi:bifunctional phosphopantothenoylcysteine decarboxylase/phosphopantothenate synthase [Alteriqipengyuania lutimaris]|uniref:Coenzyme A biosynthesis bifunctional protein CoaBC n=1 Tax=Alteriqipengyuania lutimaris TaxID=1538146 RepID=A0A395LHG9_9SPHN|nr:bifunctional phosphopantothenoylcysteine decarboxylase/phosphopantothenate synthase [Alteriqipengyuania lutimaris]MBB3034775.1 phosphopantothenoylcysteine decarboxylase/phosphopantothenate--cysteine ligase [Alteriqipengyuania lutimaris]RDS76378.1 bifunctional phosphopantothenoylcysteine decarboxylase/phosphopantothenate synthase [Alteriqipengyuania lutimaris]